MVGLPGVYLYRLRRRPVQRLVVGGCVGGSVIGWVLMLVLVLALVVVVVAVAVAVVVLGEGLGDVGGYYRFPLSHCSWMDVVAATAAIGASSLCCFRRTMPYCGQN